MGRHGGWGVAPSLDRQSAHEEELNACADPDPDTEPEPTGAIGSGSPSAASPMAPQRASLAVSSSSSYLMVSRAVAVGAATPALAGLTGADAEADCEAPAAADEADVIGAESRAAVASEDAALRRTMRTDVASPAHDVRKRSFDRAILR